MFVYISFTSVYTIESAVFTRPQAKLHMDTALFPQIPRHFCEKHLRREIQEHSLELRRRRQESVLVWRERDREKERQAPWVSTFFNTLFAFLLALHILSENILMFILSRRKRIRRAGALSQETLVMTRVVQTTRRL